MIYLHLQKFVMGFSPPFRCLYPYWQYTNLFIFGFVSLLCLRSTLRLFNLTFAACIIDQTLDSESRVC